jgi:Mlc titration factor MtfA (ptsG expression regulator)
MYFRNVSKICLPLEYVLIFIGIIFLLFFFYHVIAEPLYAFVFRKPIYVHFYLFPKKIPLSQLQILHTEFDFYKKLSLKEKKYFEHRVATFIVRYEFHGREGLVVTDQMRVLIAATAIMLTFGMRNYLFTLLDKVIIFPDIYFSSITNNYHKGEFNPRMRAIVFSWKHFLEGFEISNDNLNLGLHEFAHVIHFEGLRKTDTSSTIFAASYEDIMEQIKRPSNYKRLIDSNYFRIYAYTNQYEFIAVLLEHFFETPRQFKSEFPELFEQVKIMINFKEDL